MTSAISLREIVKTYPGSGRVLDGVSLQIDEGERVAIVGPSGSGKSTLLHIMGTLERFDAGSMAIAGRGVSSLSDSDLADVRASKIGFVFQQFFLIEALDIIENVEQSLLYGSTPTSEREARARNALEVVGLGRRLHHLPNQLSGGERQRAAIARAIAPGPSILLADEPTGNLDSRTGAEILGLLLDLEQNAALVVITHDEAVAAALNRRIALRDGRVEQDDGSPPT